MGRSLSLVHPSHSWQFLWSCRYHRRSHSLHSFTPGIHISASSEGAPSLHPWFTLQPVWPFFPLLFQESHTWAPLNVTGWACSIEQPACLWIPLYWAQLHLNYLQLITELLDWTVSSVSLTHFLHLVSFIGSQLPLPFHLNPSLAIGTLLPPSGWNLTLLPHC